MTKPTAKNLSILFFAFLAIWTARIAFYVHFETILSGDFWKSFFGIGCKWIFWVILPVIYLKIFDKTSVLKYLKLKGSTKPAIIGTVLAIIFGIILKLILIQVKNDTNIGSFYRMLEILFFAAIPEEILMRGFFLNKFLEIMKPAKAVIITSVMFLLLHWPGWIAFSGYNLNQFVYHSSGVLAVGTICGILMIKSKSLYPGIVFHAVWDIILSTG